MRQIFSLLIGFTVLTSVAACGGETEQTTQAAPKAASTQSTTEKAPAQTPAPPTGAAEKADMPKAEQAEALAEEKTPAIAEASAKASEEKSAQDTAAAADGTVHEVRMLNADPDDRSKKMVYIPRVLRIAPGDTVRFIPENPGHNSASTKGMTPDGFEGWKSRINETFDVTLTTPGIYGYNCTPHKATGMVGLVIVEGSGMLDNLEVAKDVRKIGKARGVWEDIWAEAEASGALTP